MKRFMPLMLMMAVLVALIGCQKKHPVKVNTDPEMKSGDIEQIAVFPFASSIHDSDDPDDMAPQTMNRLFRQELSARSDYKFLSPESVEYALRGEGLDREAKEFVEGWRKSKEIDRQFLMRLSEASPVEAILIGVVDLWQKDEVDYRETSAAATYVGATITIIRVSDGKVLFEAVDEDFLEGALSESGSRGANVGASGAVQADRSSNMYQAPEFEEVAIKVARALALSIPQR